MERHDEVKLEVAEWLEKEVKQKCRTEQIIPEWGRVNPVTQIWEAAKLDIVYQNQRGQRICVDVAIVDGSENEGLAKHAILRREAAKHARYPEAYLYPFVLDTRGKWGNEACAWAAMVLKDVEPEERAVLIRSLRIRTSVAIQRSVADQIICATQEIKNPVRS
jgi:hypothetical protein